MAKRAATKTTVTKTSQPSKTIVRKDAPAPKATPAAAPVRAVTRTIGPAKDPVDAPPRPAGVTSHDDNQATIEQLNGQLGAIRGLPQYADEERDLTERIAALTGQPVKA